MSVGSPFRPRSRSLAALGLLALSACLPKLEPPPDDVVPSPPPPAPSGAASGQAPPVDPGLVWQETFARPDLKALGWGSPSRSDDDELAAVFSLEREGDLTFLHARHDGRPETDGPDPPHFGRAWEKGQVALQDACRLTWRWRVRQHPAPHEDPWADLGASLYVIFDTPGLISGAEGFKLGWLRQPGPEGTKQRGIVQIPQRVDPATGAWHDEEVDLCALYREHYGKLAGVPLLYVGVVTDGDNSESIAEADYANIVVTQGP